MIEPKQRLGRALGWILASALTATLCGGCSSCGGGDAADAKADASAEGAKSGTKAKKKKKKTNPKSAVKPRRVEPPPAKDE